MLLRMPVDRLAQLLGVVSLAAVDRLGAATAEELGHGGVAPAALVHLEAYPGEPLEGLRVALRISQPGVVRVVDRLEGESLVERRPGRDGRARALHLSAAGQRMARSVRERRGAALAEVLAPLEPGERERLLPLLERLTAGLADDRPQALAVCRLCDRSICCGGDRRACPLQHTADAP